MVPITSNITLVIKRAFAPNKNKKTGKTLPGTSIKQVQQVMGQFGNIENTQFITKQDYKTGENFRVFFIHFNSIHLMSDEYKMAIEKGGTIEVGNDDKGHYWLVTKYVPSETSVNKTSQNKKTSQPISHGVRVRKAPPPLNIDIESQSSYEDSQIPQAPTEEKVITFEE